MFTLRTLLAFLLALLSIPAFAQKTDFDWSWHEQEVIGRNDASVGNTSKLTEPERAQLLDAIVQHLQKPMSEAGYDDDRIREIASTSRIRSVQFGPGKPLIFTTSIGMEGGCDPLGNCPLWIFRRSSGGFAPLLDDVAASYTVQSTVQSTDDLVLMHHISKMQSGLEVYRLEDGKLTPAGCYIANWPTPSEDPAQISDPEVVACKEGTAEPVLATPESKPEMPAASAGEAKPDSPDQKPELCSQPLRQNLSPCPTHRPRSPTLRHRPTRSLRCLPHRSPKATRSPTRQIKRRPPLTLLRNRTRSRRLPMRPHRMQNRNRLTLLSLPLIPSRPRRTSNNPRPIPKRSHPPRRMLRPRILTRAPSPMRRQNRSPDPMRRRQIRAPHPNPMRPTKTNRRLRTRLPTQRRPLLKANSQQLASCQLLPADCQLLIAAFPQILDSGNSCQAPQTWLNPSKTITHIEI